MEVSRMEYSSSRYVLVLVAAVVLSACGGGAGDRYGQNQVRLKVSPPITDVVSPEAESYGDVEFLRFIDTEGSDVVLERPTYVGYDPHGGDMVVAELSGCELKLIGWQSGRVSRRLGRCGEGPGEFGFILGMALHSDTIFVLEQTGLWKALDGSGAEHYRYRLQDSFPDLRRAASFVSKNEHGLAVVVATVVDSIDRTVESWGRHVAVLSNGKGVMAPVRASAVAGTIVEDWGPYFYNSACTSPDFHLGVAGYMVVAQPMAFESVVLDHGLSPVASSFFTPPWLRSRHDSISAMLDTVPQLPGIRGEEFTVGDRVYVVCGPSFYVVSTRAFVGRDVRVEDAYGILEARRYDGELIARRAWYGGLDGGQLGSPRVIVGDTLVATTVDRLGELRLVAWTFGSGK